VHNRPALILQRVSFRSLGPHRVLGSAKQPQLLHCELVGNDAQAKADRVHGEDDAVRVRSLRSSAAAQASARFIIGGPTGRTTGAGTSVAIRFGTSPTGCSTGGARRQVQSSLETRRCLVLWLCHRNNVHVLDEATQGRSNSISKRLNPHMEREVVTRAARDNAQRRDSLPFSRRIVG